MNKDMAFAYKVIFASGVMFGGTLAWGLRNIMRRRDKLSMLVNSKNMYEVESGMAEGCIKILGDIANKVTMKDGDNCDKT